MSFSFKNTRLFFTDGTYLDTAYGWYGVRGSGVEDYKEKQLKMYACGNDSDGNVYGFIGQKTDKNGNIWTFSATGISVQTPTGENFTYNGGNATPIIDKDGNSHRGYRFFGIEERLTTVETGNNGRYTIKSEGLFANQCDLFPKYHVSWGAESGAISYYVDGTCFVRSGDLDSLAYKSKADYLADYVGGENVLPHVVKARGWFYEFLTLANQGNNFITIDGKFRFMPSLISGTGAQNNDVISFASSAERKIDVIEVSEDPYNQNGATVTGGGEGTFDGSSDSVDFPALPTFSAADTGFVTLFNPSLQGLKDLAHFLWSDLIGASFEQTLNALKRVVSDPMDAILSLHVVPVPVPSSGSRNVGIYDIVSTVSLPLASTQYVILDCGTLNVKEFWGAYLDYSPYTKIEIYLPYIGIESLNIDDVMSKPVHVKYYIDLLTGGCVAFVKCGNSVLYQFSGSCALPIPFNSVNYTNTITGILSAAASIGGAIASGGLSAPLSAVGAAASVAQGAANAAQMASSSKPNVKKSGTMGGATGFLGIQKPYLILTRPRQAVAGFQNIYEGYPSHITSKLSDVHGFAQMEVLVADGLSCSEPEKNEIVSLLESGVFLP